MQTFRVGPNPVQLTGHPELAQPGTTVQHDFSPAGPDGEHGLARLAALLIAGALVAVDDARRRGAHPIEKE